MPIYTILMGPLRRQLSSTPTSRVSVHIVRFVAVAVLYAAVGAAVFAKEVVPGFYYYEDQAMYHFDGRLVSYTEFERGPDYLDFGGRIAFTFDDVVFNDTLGGLLDALAEHNIRAVFFLTGNRMDHTPREVLRAYLERMIREGHVLGNHSYSHPQFDRGYFNDGTDDVLDIREELDLLEDYIDGLLGYHYPMRYVRPPFGLRGNDEETFDARLSVPGNVDKALAIRGQELIQWHINSLDFQIIPGQEHVPDDLPRLAAERVADSRGGIILLHSNSYTNRVFPETLDAILSVRTASGEPVRISDVDELFHLKYSVARDGGPQREPALSQVRSAR